MIKRLINTKVLVCLIILVSPCLTFAERLTLDKANSLTSNNLSGQFRVMIEFNNDSNSATTATTPRSVSNSLRVSHKDEYLLKTINSEISSKAARKTNLGGRYIRPNLRTMSVSKSELMNLLADDDLTIYEDKFHKPSLASSINVVFPTQSESAFSGSGQTVAILDTGVNKNHAFLSGSVIASAEACFSTNDPNNFIESLCPNGQDSMIGSGAGVACDSSIADCAHGTQMAGVIAGEGASFSGVATSATIISVQIYSVSNDEIFCGNAANTPCIGANTSDIVRALDYINSIKSSHSIAAVNISAGTTITYQGQCDGDEPASYIQAIEDLVSSRIAVIASSGNDALANEMSSPACLSDVIAVAATSDSDVAWENNNRNSELDFFAPGVAVTTSSLPNNSFTAVDGTSVAAAHVSGAWAVMKSQTPNASVNAIRNRLRVTGRSITQGLFTEPRIDITDALDEEFDFEIDFLPSIYLLLDDD